MMVENANKNWDRRTGRQADRQAEA